MEATIWQALIQSRALSACRDRVRLRRTGRHTPSQCLILPANDLGAASVRNSVLLPGGSICQGLCDAGPDTQARDPRSPVGPGESGRATVLRSARRGAGPAIRSRSCISTPERSKLMPEFQPGKDYLEDPLAYRLRHAFGLCGLSCVLSSGPCRLQSRQGTGGSQSGMRPIGQSRGDGRADKLRRPELHDEMGM
jgi:hypothetical protein